MMLGPRFSGSRLASGCDRTLAPRITYAYRTNFIGKNNVRVRWKIKNVVTVTYISEIQDLVLLLLHFILNLLTSVTSCVDIIMSV